MHKTILRNHKQMGQGKCHTCTGLSQNQMARSQWERNPVSGATEMPIPATSAQPRMQHAHSVASKDIERACLLKKGIDKSTNLQAKSKQQIAVSVDPDEDSSEYGYDFDLRVVSIHAVINQKSRELFASELFHSKGDSSLSYEIRGKVDTGAMVSCMPTSML